MTTQTNRHTDKPMVIDTIAAGDAEFQDGDGSSTSTYNNSGASSTNDVTFLEVPQLKRVNDASVSVEVDDTDAATGTLSAEAEPASEGVADDLDGVADGSEANLLILTLRDTSDGTEIASDTDVSDLELNVTAIQQ